MDEERCDEARCSALIQMAVQQLKGPLGGVLFVDGDWTDREIAAADATVRRMSEDRLKIYRGKVTTVLCWEA